MSIRDINGEYGGVGVAIKASKLQALHVAQAASAYEEAVERGNVYLMAAQTAAVTTATLQTASIFAIANRVGSGKIVKLWYAGCSWTIAMTAVSIVYVCLGGYSATAVTETTAATVRNAKTGDSGAPSGIGCLIAATLPAAPVGVAVLGGITTAAITVNSVVVPVGRWFDGSLWVQPGYNLSIQTVAAATVYCDFIFEVQDA